LERASKDPSLYQPELSAETLDPVEEVLALIVGK
jgi:hypothetical protein